VGALFGLIGEQSYIKSNCWKWLRSRFWTIQRYLRELWLRIHCLRQGFIWNVFLFVFNANIK
jgi:hypothetical protein